MTLAVAVGGSGILQNLLIGDALHGGLAGLDQAVGLLAVVALGDGGDHSVEGAGLLVTLDVVGNDPLVNICLAGTAGAGGNTVDVGIEDTGTGGSLSLTDDLVTGVLVTGSQRNQGGVAEAGELASGDVDELLGDGLLCLGAGEVGGNILRNDLLGGSGGEALVGGSDVLGSHNNNLLVI